MRGFMGSSAPTGIRQENLRRGDSHGQRYCQAVIVRWARITFPASGKARRLPNALVGELPWMRVGSSRTSLPYRVSHRLHHHGESVATAGSP
jgi:hypothetical protein